MPNPWEIDWGQSAPKAEQMPWQMPWNEPQVALKDKPSFGAPEVEDAAKSFGVGVGKGAVGIAGLPKDLGDIAASGIQAGADKLGLTIPDSLKNPTETWSGLNLPGSQEIQKNIEQYTGPCGWNWAGRLGRKDCAPSGHACCWGRGW